MLLILTGFYLKVLYIYIYINAFCIHCLKNLIVPEMTEYKTWEKQNKSERKFDGGCCMQPSFKRVPSNCGSQGNWGGGGRLQLFNQAALKWRKSVDIWAKAKKGELFQACCTRLKCVAMKEEVGGTVEKFKA